MYNSQFVPLSTTPFLFFTKKVNSFLYSPNILTSTLHTYLSWGFHCNLFTRKNGAYKSLSNSICSIILVLYHYHGPNFTMHKWSYGVREKIIMYFLHHVITHFSKFTATPFKFGFQNKDFDNISIQHWIQDNNIIVLTRITNFFKKPIHMLTFHK